MKKTILPFLLGIVLTLACIALLISPWWHLFMSPTKNAHCLPIDFPEPPFDDPIYRDIPEPYTLDVYRTDTSIETVKDYYESQLTHSTDWRRDEDNYWTRREVRSGEFLYECSGTLNWEEAEMGCIYLRERDGKTIVERIWLYAPSSVPLCEWYMSELPY